MNITNPKVLIFFLAFFVQFLTAGPDAWPVSAQMLVLGATFMAASFATFSTMAFLAGSVADRLRTPRVQAVTNKVSAAIFIALAVSTLLWNAS